MTDRFKGFVVVLDADVREDDAEDIKKALGMVKGVIEVAPVAVATDDFINRSRIRMELVEKLFNVLRSEPQ